jgi:hypothetical protein
MGQNLRYVKYIITIALAGLFMFAMFAAISTQASHASVAVEKAVFTFTDPVQVPGRVLPPGTYLFKLEENEGDLNVVEIKNLTETKVYGVFVVGPLYRTTAPTRPAILFDESAPGTPKPIKAWFYPGDNYGKAFVYSK